MYAFHSNGRSPWPLRDEPVVFFDDRARRGVAIEAAKAFARNSAIGPLRTVFVNHVKKSELNSRGRLPCHFGFLSLFNDGYATHRGRRRSHRGTSGKWKSGRYLGARA